MNGKNKLKRVISLFLAILTLLGSLSYDWGYQVENVMAENVITCNPNEKPSDYYKDVPNSTYYAKGYKYYRYYCNNNNHTDDHSNGKDFGNYGIGCQRASVKVKSSYGHYGYNYGTDDDWIINNEYIPYGLGSGSNYYEDVWYDYCQKCAAEDKRNEVRKQLLWFYYAIPIEGKVHYRYIGHDEVDFCTFGHGTYRLSKYKDWTDAHPNWGTILGMDNGMDVNAYYCNGHLAREPIVHTVQYNLNGGSGRTPNPQSVNSYAGFTVASNSGIYADDYDFTGWAVTRTKDGKTEVYGYTDNGMAWVPFTGEYNTKKELWYQFGANSGQTLNDGWIMDNCTGAYTFTFYAQWNKKNSNTSKKSTNIFDVYFENPDGDWEGPDTITISCNAGEVVKWTLKDNEKYADNTDIYEWSDNYNVSYTATEGTRTNRIDVKRKTYKVTVNKDGNTISSTEITDKNGLSETWFRVGQKVKIKAKLKDDNDTYTYSWGDKPWSSTDVNISFEKASRNSTGSFVMPTKNVAVNVGAESATKVIVNHYVMNTYGKYSSTPTITDVLENKKVGSTIKCNDIKKSSLEVTNGIVFDSNESGKSKVIKGGDVINLYYKRYSYKLTLEKGTGILSVTGSGTYYYGRQAEINANVKNGYSWNNWKDVDKKTVFSTLIKTKLGMPCNSLIIMADAKPNIYTVVYEKNKPSKASSDILGTVNDTKCTYDEYAVISDNTYTLKGWHFKEWNTQPDGSGDAYKSGTQVINMTSENNGVVTLYAQWEANRYILELDENNVKNKKTQYELVYDEKFELTYEPQWIGFVFDGWYNVKKFNKENIKESIKENNKENNKENIKDTNQKTNELKEYSGSLINLTDENNAKIILYANWLQKNLTVTKIGALRYNSYFVKRTSQDQSWFSLYGMSLMHEKNTKNINAPIHIWKISKDGKISKIVDL